MKGLGYILAFTFLFVFTALLTPQFIAVTNTYAAGDSSGYGSFIGVLPYVLLAVEAGVLGIVAFEEVRK